MTIAFLGLGRMGSILAGHLLDADEALVVWNRTPSAADPLTARGAVVSGSPADAVVDAGVVVTVLFGPDSVREVIVDADLPWRTGTTWVDVTTVSPADAEAYAAWAQAAGLRYVHAPVVGSLAPARAGTLGVHVGGDPEGVQGALRLVSHWADPQKVRVFDTAAQAATAKLVANLALAVSMQGVVEALRLGTSAGLDRDQVLDLLGTSTLAPVTAAKGPLVGARDYDDTQFSVDLLAKDLRLMLHSSDRALPAVTAALDGLLAAARAGHGGRDFAVIAEGV